MPYLKHKKGCKHPNKKKGTYIVIKKTTNKIGPCHKSRERANSISETMNKIEEYFNNLEDEDYMAFDDHPLSSIEDLMDFSKPAPWDHLTNSDDDEDVDVDIEEYIKK